VLQHRAPGLGQERKDLTTTEDYALWHPLFHPGTRHECYLLLNGFRDPLRATLT